MTKSMRRAEMSCAAQRQLVAVLCSLCAEVEAATDALAGNRLGDLNQHVARQEELCAKLELIVGGEAKMSSRLHLESANAAPLRAEIVASQSRLAFLTRRFSALLRRCQRTAALLEGHYRALLGFGTGEWRIPEQPSWSSEA